MKPKRGTNLVANGGFEVRIIFTNQVDIFFIQAFVFPLTFLPSALLLLSPPLGAFLDFFIFIDYEPSLDLFWRDILEL